MGHRAEELTLDGVVPQEAPAWCSAEAARILDDIRRTVTDRPKDARAAASKLVNLLSMPGAAATHVRGGLAPWQKRKIEHYVKEHLTETLPVELLADQLSLSASYFHHAFKDTFGASPHVYITKLRIEAAQALMRTTDEPLGQIALACGFADQSHLCKVFRREQGETPSAWQRRNVTGADRRTARPAQGRHSPHATALKVTSHARHDDTAQA